MSFARRLPCEEVYVRFSCGPILAPDGLAVTHLGLDEPDAGDVVAIGQQGDRQRLFWARIDLKT